MVNGERSEKSEKENSGQRNEHEWGSEGERKNFIARNRVHESWHFQGGSLCRGVHFEVNLCKSAHLEADLSICVHFRADLCTCKKGALRRGQGGDRKAPLKVCIGASVALTGHFRAKVSICAHLQANLCTIFQRAF